MLIIMIQLITKNPWVLILLFFCLKVYTVWEALTGDSSFLPSWVLMGLAYVVFGIFEILIAANFDYFKDKQKTRLFLIATLFPGAIYILGQAIKLLF